MNGTEKINHIDFSRIRDFVLTPGALLYATMTRRGLARSINDVSRKIYEAHGIEESVIVDFSFDRIPLNNELAVAIAPFFFWQPVENIWKLYNEYLEKRKDRLCLVLNVNDIMGLQIKISSEDIDRLKKETKEYCEKRQEECMLVKKVCTTLDNLIMALHSLRDKDQHYYEMEMLEDSLHNRRKLLSTLLLQRELNHAENRSAELDELNEIGRYEYDNYMGKGIQATTAHDWISGLARAIDLIKKAPFATKR